MNTSSYLISFLLLSVLGLLIYYSDSATWQHRDKPLAITAAEKAETTPSRLAERLDAIASATASPYQRR